MFAHTCGECRLSGAASGTCVAGLQSAPVAKVLTKLAECVTSSTRIRAASLPAAEGSGAIKRIVIRDLDALPLTPRAPLSLAVTGADRLGFVSANGVGKNGSCWSLSAVRSMVADSVAESA